MALTGPSFTVRGKSYSNGYKEVYEAEARKSHDKTQYIKDMVQHVRLAIEAGAEAVEVICWNNWTDGYGSVRYQSVSLSYVDHGLDSKRTWFRLRRCNIF